MQHDLNEIRTQQNAIDQPRSEAAQVAPAVPEQPQAAAEEQENNFQSTEDPGNDAGHNNLSGNTPAVVEIEIETDEPAAVSHSWGHGYDAQAEIDRLQVQFDKKRAQDVAAAQGPERATASNDWDNDAKDKAFWKQESEAEAPFAVNKTQRLEEDQSSNSQSAKLADTAMNTDNKPGESLSWSPGADAQADIDRLQAKFKENQAREQREGPTGGEMLFVTPPEPPNEGAKMQEQFDMMKELQRQQKQGASTSPELPISQPVIETTGLGISLNPSNENKSGTQSQNQSVDDLDFESMFGMDPAPGDKTEDAEMLFEDLFTNAVAEQGGELGDGGDFDLSSFGEPANAPHEDVTAMLESLDNFGNAGNGDFDMMAASNTAPAGDSGEQDMAQSAGGENFDMNGGDLDIALGLDNNESTFDDLLDGIDFGDGGDDGGGMDAIEHGEFDDAFFGTE